MPKVHIPNNCGRRSAACCLVVVVAASLGVAYALLAVLDFSYHSQQEIRGWLSTNQYSKQQELFWYSYFVVLIPVLCFAALWLQRTFFAKQVAPEDASTPSYSGLNEPKIDAAKSASTKIPLWSLLWRRAVYAPLTYIAIPITIFLLITAQSSDGIIDFFHEGETLSPAFELRKGGIPFRDIYVQHGAIKNIYLAVIGFELFGETVEGLRKIELVAMALTAVAVYALCLVLFRGRVILATFLTIQLTCWQYWVQSRNFFPLLCVIFLCLWLRTILRTISAADLDKHKTVRASLLLVTSGMFSAASFWFSVDVGIYTILGAGIFLALFHALHRTLLSHSFVRTVTLFLSGALVVHLPVSVYLLWHGAFIAMLENVYIQCVYQLQVWGLPFPSPTQLLSELSGSSSGITSGDVSSSPAGLWSAVVRAPSFSFYLPILVYCGTGVYLVYSYFTGQLKGNETRLQALLLLLISILFFRTALGRSSLGHIVNGTTFFWMLCFLPLDRSLATLGSELRKLVETKGIHRGDLFPTLNILQPVSIVLLSLPLIIYILQRHEAATAYANRWAQLDVSSFLTANNSKTSVPSPDSGEEKLLGLGDVSIPQTQAEQIERVVAYINSRLTAEEQIFDFSNNGAYYFFARRTNPTRYHQVAYAATVAQQHEVIAALEADKTPLVIYRTGTGWDAPDQVPNELRHWLIAEYLQQHYQPAREFAGTVLLERR